MPYENVNDIKIYYEIHGPPDGPPLVCLEGWGVALWMWFRQIPAFSKLYKCIIFDNRGVGKTSKPDSSYTIQMFANDTIGLMKNLGIAQAHILGISMGGYIAQQIALSYPEKVRSLILASTTFAGGPKNPNIISPDNKTMAKIFAMPTETISMDQAYAMRISTAYSQKFLTENKALLKQIKEWQDENPQPDYARLRQASAALAFDIEAELEQVTVPTLILHGENDLILPPKNGEMLADRIQSSRLVLFKNGPHWIFIERYEDFNRLILDFLADVERNRAKPEPKRIVI